MSTDKPVSERLALTALQQSILDAANPDVPLVVFRRKAQHGKGMSFLSRRLIKDHGWTMCAHIMTPRVIKKRMESAQHGVYFDLPCAVQFMPLVTRKVFKTVNDNKISVPVIVMCHGDPPPMLTREWNKLDVTDAPEATH